MNGCIDFNTPDHKGLETVVGQLDQSELSLGLTPSTLTQDLHSLRLEDL